MLKNIFVGMLSFILYNLNLSQREDMEGLQSSAVSIQSFCFWRADKQAAPWKWTKKKNMNSIVQEDEFDGFTFLPRKVKLKNPPKWQYAALQLPY